MSEAFLAGSVEQGSCRSVVVSELFERYAGRVYAFARRLVDPVTAEDVVQDVFIRMMTASDLEARSITIGYLLKTAENLIRQRHRTTRRQRAMPGREADFTESPAGAGAPEVVHAFRGLSAHEQEALRLVVCEGLSYKSAAQAMNVSVTTLNNWKFRAIQKLKDEAMSCRCAG